MKFERNIAFIVDDDPDLRMSLQDLLASHGLRTFAFASTAEYLVFGKPAGEACLILEARLPHTSGLDFQRRIIRCDHPPIIFITGLCDVSAAVQAIRLGAVDFLLKPVQEADLIRAVYAAFALDKQRRKDNAEREELRQRLSQLTPRETQVLPLVVSGLLNKQAAAELGISEITYQIHRGKVMRKMKAGSLPDLVRIAEKLQVQVVASRGPGTGPLRRCG